MGKREQLHEVFKTIAPNVYHQPPETIKIIYPCIIYSRNNAETIFANNNPYNIQLGYKVMVIDRNPDGIIPGKVELLPRCKFDRAYSADNLNHWIYNLYY